MIRQGAGMKDSILHIILLAILIAIVLFVSACNNQQTSQITTTNGLTTSSVSPETSPQKTSTITMSPVVTLPTSANISTVQLQYPDSGIIMLDGKDYRFQRVFTPIKEPTLYQGVVFSPYIPEGTLTGPVAYWFTVRFADGTEEQLQYVGLGNLEHVSIKFTKNDNPQAGVMLAWQRIEGSLNPVIYLLVSD
jgi:hypothetical protein